MVDLDRLMEDTDTHFLGVLALFFLSGLFLVYSIWDKPMVWDSSIYVAMGKNIYSGGFYGLWESFRPPVLPAVLGLFWKLGFPTIGFPRLLSLLVSTGGVAALYYVARDLYSAKEAVIAAGILAGSHTYYFFTATPLTGIPASIMVLLTVYLAGKNRWLAAGLLAAVAFLTRFPAAVIAPIVVFYTVSRYYLRDEVMEGVENSVLFSAGFWSLTAVYLFMNYISYGSFLEPFKSGFGIPASAGSTYMAGLYYAVQSVKAHPLTALFPLGIYSVVRRKEWSYGLSLLTLLSFYVFFTTFPLKIERYMLLFLPLIAIFAARGIRTVWNSTDLPVYSIALLFILGFLTFTASQVWNTYNWENPEEERFFSEVSDLNGSVATNDPRSILYADFRYHELPPEILPSIFEEKGGEIDYWVVNSCSWDCRGRSPECESKIESFEDALSNRYTKAFEAEGGSCNYTIYASR